MKTMKKKAWFVAVFAATLIIAALVAGCINPVTGSSFLGGKSSPEGTGGLFISFGKNSNALTILPLPAAQAMTTTNVAAFGLAFSGSGGIYYVTNTGTNTVSVTGVPVGTYDLTITAYKTAPAGEMGPTNLPTVPILSGTATNVTISSVTSASANVTMRPITTGTNGTFSYTIGNGVTGLASANLQIRDDLGTAATGTRDIDLTATATSWSSAAPISLAPGYYYAYLTLTKGPAPVVTKTIIELIRVYQNLETPWTGFTVASGYFPGTEGGGNFTLFLDVATESTPLLYDIAPTNRTISKGGTPNTLTVTVSNADDYTIGMIWRIDGANAVTSVTDVDATTKMLTISAAGYNVGQIYPVYVEGEDDDGRNSLTFEFTVVE
jgi:hypothetical protein